jgi:Tol biopolymer transport system component
VQIIPPADVHYSGLRFSRDGDFLYFSQDDSKEGLRSLYKIPVLGGAARKLIAHVGSEVTLSPDGKRLAFERDSSARDESALIVANEDGTGERQLAVRKLPDGFEDSVAWSPNGKSIATGVDHSEGGVEYTSLAEVSVEGGAERPLSQQRWVALYGLAWVSDGRGLVVNTQEQTGGALQLGFVSYPSGEFRKITSDPNSYNGISVTADSRVVATVQTQRSFDVWVAPVAEADSAKPVTSDGNTAWPTWRPDGRIICLRYARSSANLWSMEADGSNATQLTSDTANMKFCPRVTRDGRYMVFLSDRNGSIHIWRTDIDGANPKQLTSSPMDFPDSRPDLSPDGKWVVYVKWGPEQGVWKAPVEGGDAVRLNDADAGRPAVSPDGKWIAYTYRDNKATPKHGVAIMRWEGGPPSTRLDIATDWIQWASDGRSLLYIKNEGGVGNLWRQPIVGGSGKQITHFNSDLILGFEVSRDGKSLIMVRGNLPSNVVLIRDVR